MEEKDNVYTSPQTAHTAEAEKRDGATDLGKFKDVDALMKAYNALQAEFTRRSQRLRVLENAVDNSNKSSENAFEAEKAGGLIAPATAACEPTVADTARPSEEINVATEQEENRVESSAQTQTVSTQKQTSDELYEAVVQDEMVRKRIIGEYLTSLQGANAPLMKGGTGMPAVTRKKATNFSEAGTMALHFFKNENQ